MRNQLDKAIRRVMAARHAEHRRAAVLVILALLTILSVSWRLHQVGIAMTDDELTYIDEFYMENFSIRDLADACSMSESHFRRVFRELVGMGPLDYLNRTRIAKACSLLRMTDDSILTISEKVGFGSMSSFNRHFYEVMGTAPSDWRRATGTGIGTSILKYSGWLRPPAP